MRHNVHPCRKCIRTSGKSEEMPNPHEERDWHVEAQVSVPQLLHKHETNPENDMTTVMAEKSFVLCGQKVLSPPMRMHGASRYSSSLRTPF
jgi:hypothetical protein